MEVFVAGGDSASDDDPIDVEFGLGQRITAWHIPAERERPCAVFWTYARLIECGIELVSIRNAPTTVAMRRQFGDHLEQKRYVEAGHLANLCQDVVTLIWRSVIACSLSDSRGNRMA